MQSSAWNAVRLDIWLHLHVCIPGYHLLSLLSLCHTNKEFKNQQRKRGRWEQEYKCHVVHPGNAVYFGLLWLAHRRWYGEGWKESWQRVRMSLAQETDTKVPVLHITEYWPSSSTDTQKGPAATSSAAGTQRVQCQKKKKKKKERNPEQRPQTSDWECVNFWHCVLVWSLVCEK